MELSDGVRLKIAPSNCEKDAVSSESYGSVTDPSGTYFRVQVLG